MLVMLMASCVDNYSFTLGCWVNGHDCSCCQPQLMLWVVAKLGTYIQKYRHKHIKGVDAHTHKMQIPLYCRVSYYIYNKGGNVPYKIPNPLKSLIIT